MELTILSATGLKKADMIGSSDPYAVVLVDGVEIARTRTMFNTLDPVWREPRQTIPLRLVQGQNPCGVVIQLWDEDLGEMGNKACALFFFFHVSFLLCPIRSLRVCSIVLFCPSLFFGECFSLRRLDPWGSSQVQE